MLLSGLLEVVTTTLDVQSLDGTLRGAINRIDANPDTTSLNTIIFQVPTTDPNYNPANGTFTIRLDDIALPPITNPAFVDGTTEASFIGQPALVVINGQDVLAPADGLDLEGNADGSTILGLEIVNFRDAGGTGGAGINIGTANNTIGGMALNQGNILCSNRNGISIPVITGAPNPENNNLIIGNFIGTDGKGANLANEFGVGISTPNNTIGGTTAGAANVIGFNTVAGVAITGTLADQNVVIGNLIGANAAGANLANSIGVIVGSQSNTIGGATPGAANVFGFNSTAGVQITGSGATANVVLGNFFGTGASGGRLPNTVGMIVESAGNTIGGTTPGAANVFGNEVTAGLQFTGAGATANVVLGNFFGTNGNGDNLGNPVGISLDGGLNTIGGPAAGMGNVFGFNSSAGLIIVGVDATDETVIGNLFGTNAAGANLGNAVGVLLQTGNNTIGGTSPGTANVFGFNTSAGLRTNGTPDVVVGNFFGTNAGGANLGNTVGVLLQTANNTIGGTSAGAANVFGFNTVTGVRMNGPNEVVVGNLFGTSAAGANLGNVVGILDNSGSNTIGGTSAQAANVFGFNTTGLQINGSNDSVIGNFFGTDANGAPIGNSVSVLDQAGGNTIGGNSSGASNVFGFSSTAGLQISGSNDSVIGNFFGTNRTGANLSNAVGVMVGSAGNTIGGAALGEGNIISFNSTAGVQINGTGASGNVLIGNYIGTDSSGTVAQGNDIGVLVSAGAANVIGEAGAGNVISGNFTAGIELTGSSVSGTQIMGNRIGTDPSGTGAVVRANEPDLTALQNAGIAIIGSVGNTVGGPSQAANVISGNYVGVNLANITAGAGQNLVAGNLIGTTAGGTAPLGNIVGIYINSAAGNQIGAVGSPNTISGNSSVGVEIFGVGSTGNVVEGNIIGLASDGQTAFTSNGLFVQPFGVFILNASGNMIGGTSGARNVISGNESAAVYIVGRSGVASGNIVQGNLIGLSISGGAGPGNNGYGVLLLNAPNNQAPLTGPAANRFGRNRIANFRKLSGKAARKVGNHVAATTSGPHSRAIHPHGPGRNLKRKNA
jgi:hypothetical protein